MGTHTAKARLSVSALRALAALCLLALLVPGAPAGAQSQLIQLDTTSLGSSFYSNTEAPKIGRLDQERFVTAQRNATAAIGQQGLILRSWRLNSSGDLVLLDTHSDYLMAFETLEKVVGIASSRFVTASRLPSGFLRLVSWNVSSSGDITKLHSLSNAIEAVGDFDLISTFSGQLFMSRLLGVGRSPGTGVFVYSWDVDLAGTVSNPIAIQLLPDATQTRIASYGQGTVATVQRLTNGARRLARWSYAPTIPSLTQTSANTGSTFVTDVDVAFSPNGRLMAAERLAAGNLRVSSWTQFTLWPGSTKVLFSTSNATTSGFVSDFVLEPLATDRVATGVMNAVNKVEVISWSATSQVAILDQIQGAFADSVDMTRLDDREVLTAIKTSYPTVQRVTAWNDLVP